MDSFHKAVQYVQTSTADMNITDDDRLQFYKYYKQATIGDCNTPMPSMFSFNDRAKWNAWNSIRGMKQEDAKAMYVQLLNTFTSI